MNRFYVSAHFSMLDPTTEPKGFEQLLDQLNEALPGAFNARAFGTPVDFVVGAAIPSRNEEEAREIWFRLVDRAVDDVGLATRSRYTSRLAFEPLP